MSNGEAPIRIWYTGENAGSMTELAREYVLVLFDGAWLHLWDSGELYITRRKTIFYKNWPFNGDPARAGKYCEGDMFEPGWTPWES